MHFSTVICLLLAIVGNSSQIHFKPDSNMRGIVFEPIKMVFIQTSTKYLTYKFNVSAVNFLDNNIVELETRCPNKILTLDLYNSAVEKMNSIWNKPSNSQTKNTKPIQLFPSKIYNLAVELNSFSFTKDDCDSLEDISTRTLIIRSNLDQMAKSNLSILDFFISSGRIQSDAKMLIQENMRHFITPFHSKMFNLEFWKYIELRFLYSNETVFIEFEIPFFHPNPVNLFSVKPKPIIWEDDAYIFNASIEYAIIDGEKPILFSSNQYYKNCLVSLNSTYCKTYDFEESPCSKFIFSTLKQNFNENCFKQLENKNMITQVGKHLYFTIFTPLQMWVSHDIVSYPICIEQSVKITEKINYNISTPFFKFDTSKPGKYEIFFENSEQDGYLCYEFSFEETKTFWTILFCALLMFVLMIFWSKLYLYTYYCYRGMYD